MTDKTVSDAKASHVAVFVLTALLLLCSLPLSYWLTDKGLVSTGNSANGLLVFFHLFVHQDTFLGPLMAALVIAALVVSWRWPSVPWITGRTAVLTVALAAAGLVYLLRFTVQHNYGLSLDEFMPTFQAEIFRQGELMARLDDDAFGQREALQPFFTYVDEEHQLWMQHYRPIHAALIALFPSGYAVATLHAILTALTIVAMADIARRLFPETPAAPILAAGLLIASPQFLLTGSSGFSFTTHLAFNTVWLALFLRGTWTAHVAAAAVGFFALGIHQVHVHAIQVFPFGIAMLLGYFGSRWKAIPYVVAYGIGVPFWIAWPEIATWWQTGDTSVLPLTPFQTEYITNYLNRSQGLGVTERSISGSFLVANIWRFLLWMSPALILLLVLALVSGLRIGRVPVIAALGFVFTVVTSHVLLPNQMYSLGSRYFHPGLVNVVIVAVAAFCGLAPELRTRQAIVNLLLLGALVLVPLRAWQVHEKVGPRANLQNELVSLDVENVIIRGGGAWFDADFVRNDPYLRNSPLFYIERPDQTIRPILSGDTVRVDGTGLVEMGLPAGTLLEPDFRR